MVTLGLRLAGTDEDTDTVVDNMEGQPENPNVGFAARFAGPMEVGEPVADKLASGINYLMTTRLDEKLLNDTAQKVLTTCKL